MNSLLKMFRPPEAGGVPEAPLATLPAIVQEITRNREGMTTARVQMSGRIFGTFNVSTDRVKPGDLLTIVVYKA